MIKRNFDKVLVLEDDAIIVGTPNDLKDIINDGNDYYYYYITIVITTITSTT